MALRNPPEPLGTAARRAALRLLDAVLRRGEPLEAALAQATRALPGGPDRGLAHAIAAETLRRLTDLDALIDSATRNRLADDVKARSALRVALVQVLALGTPPHAAIATVLPLVDGGPKRLVHGVFGTLVRGGATLPELPALPAAVAERWQAAWGEEAVAGAARAIAAPPPVDLTLRDPAETAGWAERLGGTSLARGHVRLVDPAPIAELPGYAEGAWWVQDLAASLPARLLPLPAGDVLDLCAAPGGKTLQLAAAGHRVTAIDASKSRAARLFENRERTRLAFDVAVADVLDWSPPAPADGVLVDAPCSATGIFRRHPDVLYRAHPRVVEEMAALQTRILDRAAAWVKPGGTLVYATCSLEPAEGEEQAARFLSDHDDFAVAPAREEELPAGIAPTAEGFVRTLPGTLAAAGGCDGFFIARFRKA
ncbi:RsmB/NOP family class I SAM-dependent RNA methyltransferase [Sphingomonas corticis]|jgi:16S rRNA (cytosine967-C5)-methyltransferase|uniref:RsmB/NOP family class I SAM-dependent RNA methyltransferase n=1 Tax=Sphingomonas corticis TaxID=2722791 RepID=A0ABX1CIG1_9SPHN|nr:RsmB/NOP family class I SAM-dependent RNA methyltransferase [Sphingomonas corticis]NJR77758.1 RsmB/NOP family class I SAM-dependent RNA methyltransferase [Sphingomonas corticis]